ncbi:MAG: OmpA family protein [Bacteroidetes bacterium]|nr:MAG: OmpA family protein [Bacteroidota bacterium]
MKKLLLLNMALLAGILVFGQKPESHLIKSIYFGGGSAWIDPQQVQELEEFIKAVPDIENYEISISSHTDNIGGKEYNEWLSQMRSRSVLDQLVRLNIDEDRVYIENNGQRNPFFDNRTHKGRLANRRVDIVLTMIVY